MEFEKYAEESVAKGNLWQSLWGCVLEPLWVEQDYEELPKTAKNLSWGSLLFPLDLKLQMKAQTFREPTENVTLSTMTNNNW